MEHRLLDKKQHFAHLAMVRYTQRKLQKVHHMQKIVPYVLAVIMNNNNEILLQYRSNNAWFAHHYGLPGGKIEHNESATEALARELYEEIGITIDPAQHLAHVMHFMGETQPCLALFFAIHSWQGTIENKEPSKHEHCAWFTVSALPQAMIPRHRKALQYIAQNIVYSEDNW